MSDIAYNIFKWRIKKNFFWKLKKDGKKHMVSKIFLKIEAGHVLKMFLNFGQIWASRSYKLGSYKKKTCMAKPEKKWKPDEHRRSVPDPKT